ncbi:hypothetical protein HOLleu_38842 [Holothuria leucospilota]|uniref:Uncharacterized protein n=1 Tax=Holothuria leucospilota TaxID=206669 RepID=A0A9Q0YFP7_HOLLE|nr:hypothetical protein HOLleu_38842 [Holothuria leucospilota]
MVLCGDSPERYINRGFCHLDKHKRCLPGARIQDIGKRVNDIKGQSDCCSAAGWDKQY